MVNHIERCDEVLGEAIIPEFQTMSLVAHVPDWLRTIVKYGFALCGENRLSVLTHLGYK